MSISNAVEWKWEKKTKNYTNQRDWHSMGVLDLPVRKRGSRKREFLLNDWDYREKNQALEEDDKLNLDMLSMSSLRSSGGNVQ